MQVLLENITEELLVTEFYFTLDVKQLFISATVCGLRRAVAVLVTESQMMVREGVLSKTVGCVVSLQRETSLL